MLQTGILAAPASRRAGSVCKLTPRLSARQFHFNIYFVLLPPRHKLLRRPPWPFLWACPCRRPQPRLIYCCASAGRVRTFAIKTSRFRGVSLCGWWSPHFPSPEPGAAVSGSPELPGPLSGSPGGRGSRLTPWLVGRVPRVPPALARGPSPDAASAVAAVTLSLSVATTEGSQLSRPPATSPGGPAQAAPREPPDREPEPVRVNCGAQALAPAGLPPPGLHVDRGAISQARTPRRR